MIIIYHSIYIVMDNFINIYNDYKFYKSLREELIKDNEEIKKYFKKIYNDIDNCQNILEKLKEINERLNIE